MQLPLILVISSTYKHVRVVRSKTHIETSILKKKRYYYQYFTHHQLKFLHEDIQNIWSDTGYRMFLRDEYIEPSSSLGRS